MGFRYIGAKTKIMNEVLGCISGIVDNGAHIIDLMCGTGAVSAALKDNGYDVTAVDVMTFSYHHARVSLFIGENPSFEHAGNFIEGNCQPNNENLFPTTPYEKMLDCLNCLTPIKGYFWKEFSLEGNPKNTENPRNYFTPENAMKIDSIRKCIKKLKLENMITDLEHSLLIHDLIMAVNDIANIAGTYGHFLSKTITRAKVPILLKPTIFKKMDTRSKCTVLKGHAEDLATSLVGDLCYIDPPYMKRQYAANYHVLETLAREDEPEAIGVSGLRPWRDQYSKFCTKTQIRDSFDKVFTGVDCKHFLISYSEDGLLSIDELTTLFEKYGKVKVNEFIHKRFRSNDSPLSGTLTEYLIHILV
jgi:adenine-specific DNA-methyltransferase